MFFDTDLKYDLPQSVIEIDRDKAAQLGLTMTQVGSSLGSLLGGGYVNYFSMQTRSYKVIPQVERVSRLNVEQLLDYPIANIGGVPVPLVDHRPHPHRDRSRDPESLSAVEFGHAVGRRRRPACRRPMRSIICAAWRRAPCPRVTPSTTRGPSRQFVQESGGVIGTFGFAIIIAFLTLAALYESFRDPLVILISVPLSIAGALIFIALGVHGASLNIYTQVGLVTLIGLISKHGILIVEVANEEQRSGKIQARRHRRLRRACGCAPS